jgi:hypothetical protein
MTFEHSAPRANPDPELSMYYPTLEEQLPVFETITRDTFPRLRANNTPAT